MFSIPSPLKRYPIEIEPISAPAIHAHSENSTSVYLPSEKRVKALAELFLRGRPLFVASARESTVFAQWHGTRSNAHSTSTGFGRGKDERGKEEDHNISKQKSLKHKPKASIQSLELAVQAQQQESPIILDKEAESLPCERSETLAPLNKQKELAAQRQLDKTIGEASQLASKGTKRINFKESKSSAEKKFPSPQTRRTSVEPDGPHSEPCFSTIHFPVQTPTKSASQPVPSLPSPSDSGKEDEASARLVGCPEVLQSNLDSLDDEYHGDMAEATWEGYREDFPVQTKGSKATAAPKVFPEKIRPFRVLEEPDRATELVQNTSTSQRPQFVYNSNRYTTPLPSKRANQRKIMKSMFPYGVRRDAEVFEYNVCLLRQGSKTPDPWKRYLTAPASRELSEFKYRPIGSRKRFSSEVEMHANEREQTPRLTSRKKKFMTFDSPYMPERRQTVSKEKPKSGLSQSFTTSDATEAFPSTQDAMMQAQIAFHEDLESPVKERRRNMPSDGSEDVEEDFLRDGIDNRVLTPFAAPIDTQALFDAAPFFDITPVVEAPVEDLTFDDMEEDDSEGSDDSTQVPFAISSDSGVRLGHATVSRSQRTPSHNSEIHKDSPTPTSDLFSDGGLFLSQHSDADAVAGAVQDAVNFLGTWDVESEARRTARS